MSDSVSLDDVEGLWKVGAVTMPNIAAKFSAASKAVHRANASDDVFTTPGEQNPCVTDDPFDTSETAPFVEGSSPIEAPYTALLTLFQDTVLVRTSQNCVTAGKVLCRIADSFATADHLTGTELGKYADLKDDIKDGRIAGSQIPSVPQAPSSDDPHPDDGTTP